MRTDLGAPSVPDPGELFCVSLSAAEVRASAAPPFSERTRIVCSPDVFLHVRRLVARAKEGAVDERAFRNVVVIRVLPGMTGWRFE